MEKANQSSPDVPPIGKKEAWQMTQSEWFHPVYSRKLADAKDAQEGQLLGTVGDLIQGENTRQVFKDVLDVFINFQYFIFI